MVTRSSASAASGDGGSRSVGAAVTMSNPYRARRPDASSPIGLFDSGLGGLSVLWEIRRCLPQEDVICVADTARQPYGPRSQEEVRAFSLEIAGFLCSRGVKMIVIACNTASIAGEAAIRQRFPDLPVVGMIAPAVRAALRNETARRIGVFGTALTVASGAYQDLIRRDRREAEVMAAACPELIRIAQRGLPGKEEDHLPRLIRACFQPLYEFGAEVLLLGCTDLGNIRQEIERAGGGQVRVVDPAEEVASEVRQQLQARGMLRNPEAGSGQYLLLATGSHHGLTAASAHRILEDPGLRVERLNLQAVLGRRASP